MGDFLFLYCNSQCQWHLWMKEQVEEAAWKLGYSAEIIDLTRNHEMAERYRVFFPFLTIVRGEIRIPGPVPAREIARIAREGLEATKTVLKTRAHGERSDRHLMATLKIYIPTLEWVVPWNRI